MFKQTYGFDTDILKSGTPVIVEDTEPSVRPRGTMVSFDREEDCNYYFENKSGTYLVNESSSTMLRVMSVNGELVKIPVKHFIGNKPRMTIKIYG